MKTGMQKSQRAPLKDLWYGKYLSISSDEDTHLSQCKTYIQTFRRYFIMAMLLPYQLPTVEARFNVFYLNTKWMNTRKSWRNQYDSFEYENAFDKTCVNVNYVLNTVCQFVNRMHPLGLFLNLLLGTRYSRLPISSIGPISSLG